MPNQFLGLGGRLQAIGMILAISPASQAAARCEPACGAANAECYNGQPAYIASRAVALLTYPGGCATASIIASPDLVLTAAEVLPPDAKAGDPLPGWTVDFTHECEACDDGSLKKPSVFDIAALTAINREQGWALLRVSADVAGVFGRLDAGVMTISDGIDAYQVHHGDCGAKGVQFGPLSDAFAPGTCLDGLREHLAPLAGGPGAIGSPVFRADADCLVGIVICDDACGTARIAPMSTIWPEVSAACFQADGQTHRCLDPDYSCGGGPCYRPGIWGCSHGPCCYLICGIDPFCCREYWDQICADEALDLCGGCGSPSGGNCFASHANGGCDRERCCGVVCVLDEFCCDYEWDQLCAAEACANCSCRTDIVPVGGDAVVDVDDLFFIINSWGTSDAAADVAPACGDGTVDVDDLFAVINSWGRCR